MKEVNIAHSGLEDAFSNAGASLRVRQSKLYLILTLVLVPAYVGLDYVVYPAIWHQIFIGRVLCDVAQLPCLALLFTQWGFLTATAVISLAACHYASRRRLEAFRLRHELDVNHRELASTLKKLQETEILLVQSEKMNALGKLSAGLLHEINNPLNFTFMALQIAKQDCRDNPEMSETLNDIGEGMNRIKTVISDLRAFAYPSPHSQRTPVAIEEALNAALRLTAHELGSMKVEREGMEGARALGSSTQLAHVFMNLLVNSAHAIKSASRENDAMIKVSCSEAGGLLRVCVRDNGCGVEAANLSRLMDPFFTTKAPGQGMGLGLSICHTIVKNHGGTIRIESEPGEWTQVLFDLPAPVAVRSAA